ncbi:MAG TPA: Na+/H+ antiporter NhaC family protein, partial [Saprospiraceae bacterium]|nr:Na+/H+ antiporter NhaC family protein [Saprospiraceae bacterium]
SEILYSVIATVLSASVLGDHCSPISDTTILSSLASDCNHLDHVKTQMPYALTVGAISLVCKGLATVLGGSAIVSWLMFLLAIVAMYLIIRYLGQKVEDTVVIEHT